MTQSSSQDLDLGPGLGRHDTGAALGPDPGPTLDANEERHELPITFPAWHAFAERELVRPDLTLCPPAGTQLLPSHPRMRYHSRLTVVRTPALVEARKRVAQLVRVGAGRDGVHLGLVLDGRGGTGKTTILQQVGRAHQRRQRRQRRQYPQLGDTIPVVYIALPAQNDRNNAYNMFVAIAEFLQLPTNGSLTSLVASIRTVMDRARTELILVDEIHLLADAADREHTSDHLKTLSERLSATIVYAGIDAWSIMTSGTRGEQIARRNQRLQIRPFSYTTAEERALWHSAVASYDNALCLFDHTPGELTALADYLYDRTQGFIGALSYLVCIAAQEAISDGTERITRDLLEAIYIDGASEQGHGNHAA